MTYIKTLKKAIKKAEKAKRKAQNRVVLAEMDIQRISIELAEVLADC